MTDVRAAASSHLTRPFATPDGTANGLDLFPLAGQLTGCAVSPGHPTGLDEPLLDLAPMAPPALCADGFESGDVTAWSLLTESPY